MPVRRMVAALALAVVAAGVAVSLWPLHAPGVTGNALRPRYGEFGWYAYQPLTGRVTISELRRAGVHVPQDDVEHRRRIAAELAAAGLVVAAATAIARARAATAA